MTDETITCYQFLISEILPNYKKYVFEPKYYQLKKKYQLDDSKFDEQLKLLIEESAADLYNNYLSEQARNLLIKYMNTTWILMKIVIYLQQKKEEE